MLKKCGPDSLHIIGQKEVTQKLDPQGATEDSAGPWTAGGMGVGLHHLGLVAHLPRAELAGRARSTSLEGATRHCS